MNHRIAWILICLFLIFTTIQLAPRWSPSPSRSEQTSQSADNEPGGQIIWAGISGLAPKFIDSGPNQGMGWLEYQTQAIRKTLVQSGFKLKMEYMTPARIAHEFSLKSPICHYPAEWKNPNALFAKKPDRIYSLPIDLSGDFNRSIMIHKADLPKFKKYINEKGDLQLMKLLADPALKTLLVRNSDYGSLGEQLIELDALGDQRVKPKYRRNVFIQLVRESRQLVEMLNAKRFDYIFSDSIEENDFKLAQINPDQFLKLSFETNVIKSISDPNLIYVSVACAIHPETIRAMPFINEKIKLLRSFHWTDRMLSYRRKLDRNREIRLGNDSLSTRFGGAFVDGSSDSWYALQQQHFPALLQLPKTRATHSDNETQPLPKRTAPPLEWRAYEAPKGEWTLLTTAELHLTENHRDFPHRYQVYTRRNLGQYLPNVLRDRIDSGKPANHTAASLEGLAQRLPQQIKTLHLFATGLSPEDLRPFAKLLGQPSLERLSVFDLGTASAPLLINELPPQLRYLNLSNSSIMTTNLHEKIKGMRLLSLHLNSAQISEVNFGKLLRNLPPTLEELSLGYHRESWGLENARIFASLSLPRLKTLDLENNVLSDTCFAEILKAFPPSLKVLRLGINNFLSPLKMKSLFLKGLPNLEELELTGTPFVGRFSEPIAFPARLEHLNLQENELDQGLLQLLRLPLGLKTLQIGNRGSESSRTEGLGDAGVSEILRNLGSTLRRLDLDNTGLTRRTLEVLTKSSFSNLQTLSLARNQLDALALKGLDLSQFALNELDLSNNFIDNVALAELAPKLPSSLRMLNLSSNPIGARGLEILSKHLPTNIEVLKLSSLSDFDARILSKKLPQRLKKLFLSSNGLSNSDMEVLAPHLPPTLMELHLEESDFDAKGAWVLAKHMPPHLAILGLQGTPIQSAGLKAIASQLPGSLSEISLGGFSVLEEDASALARNLPPHLSSLELQGVAFQGRGLREVLGALPNSIQNIGIGGSRLTLEDGKALADHYPNNLRRLHLDGTRSGPEVAETLAKNLPVSTETLWLPQFKMGDRGLLAFAALPLEHLWELIIGSGNEHFTEVSFRALSSKKRHFFCFTSMASKLNDKAIDAIDANLAGAMMEIWIGNDPISGPALVRLIKKMNPDANLFFFPAIKVLPQDVDAILAALPMNTGRITLSGNPIGEKNYNRFQDFIKKVERTTGVVLSVTK